ncbi:MAG TPA: copper chaperone PCu(A)C [Novosphingobium sp.]|nr:copper chaperone PCu(A)C [Novosphingobium sp.]
MKRLIAASLLALSLAACQQQQAEEPVATAPEAKPGLSAADGVLMLPAVKGNPGAAYFTLANGNDTAASLVAVAIDGAGRTEMHETVDGKMAAVPSVTVEPGKPVAFKPGGLHVMAFDMANPPEPGAVVEATLTFEGGDKLSLPLTVQARGEDHSGHEGAH